VSARAIGGLAADNLFLLAVGCGLLWGIRGWRSWTELLQLSGLAYLLGVAATGVASVLELVVGVDLSSGTILATDLILAAAGLTAGRILGRRRPALGAGSIRRPSAAAAGFAVLIAVYLHALYRSGRLVGLYEWDAWSVWVPKAKAIYFFGGLDDQFFSTLPAPTYPPLVPALEASAFHFMGTVDVVTLHLQFWFLCVGFVTAIAGLLAPRVPPLLLWPALLLVLVAPRVRTHVLAPEADYLLHYLVATAALLVGLWLLDRRPWQLVSATLLLSAALLTKREGYLLAACVLAAALIASWREARDAWPPLALAGGAALLTALPWRIWFTARDLTGEGPETGGAGLISHADRGWPSLKLTVSALFDYGEWRVVAPVAIAAVVLAAAAQARLLAGYAAAFFALGTASLAWIIWSFPSIELTKEQSVNPIVRASGSLVFAASALAPLLLAAAWRGREPTP